MYPQRTGARWEYHEKESQRVRGSLSLSDKFTKLKSLTVSLGYFDSDGVSRNSQVKYTVNLDNAKSVFRFNCPNTECIRGDFDLTTALAKAVTTRKKVLVGEMCCQGWRNKTSINTHPCHNILRYKLNMEY